MKPLIGLNVDISPGPPVKATIKEDYYTSVLKAGAVPVILPPMPDAELQIMLDRLDGLILIGGADYSPSCYGEKLDSNGELLDERRQDFDLRLVDHAMMRTSLPILGICGGCQLINIHLGGSLVQHIPSTYPESKVVHSTTDFKPGHYPTHKVFFEPGTMLHDIYKVDWLDVPTMHHQSVKKLGRGLKQSAHADDGVIEAIEDRSRPFLLGVQWHPERDYPKNSPLFAAFLERASCTSNTSK